MLVAVARVSALVAMAAVIPTTPGSRRLLTNTMNQSPISRVSLNDLCTDALTWATICSVKRLLMVAVADQSHMTSQRLKPF